MSTLPENSSSFNNNKPQEEGKKKDLHKTLGEKGPKNPEDIFLYQKLKELQKTDTDPMIVECLKALEEKDLRPNDYNYIAKRYGLEKTQSPQEVLDTLEKNPLYQKLKTMKDGDPTILQKIEQGTLSEKAEQYLLYHHDLPHSTQIPEGVNWPGWTPEMKKFGHFFEGYTRIEENGKYGFIDIEGKVVIPPIECDRLGNFFGGFAVITKDGYEKYGYIDTTGKESIPAIYEWAYNFSEGLAAVKLDGEWGYINTKGEVVIDFIYDEAGDFSGGSVDVMKGEERYTINKLGQRID